MPVQLGYWAIRGLAQSIRLLLNYVGEEFEEGHYVMGDGPDFSKDAWFSVKYSYGLDFPNLPYYIDGDLKLTHSNAILRHLARKHNLYGDTEEDKARVDMLLDQIMDFRQAFANLCYNSECFEKQRDKHIEKIKPKLLELETFLADKKFFIGDKVTVCDFHIYEMLDQHRIFEPSLLTDRPKLTEYLKRFEELPAIKTYMASDKFLSYPLNNKCAHFG